MNMRVPTEYLSPDDFEKFANRIVEKIFEKRILFLNKKESHDCDSFFA